ncbi:MAG: pyridoxal phosphate-dependent transferase [Monoraphidium minutum]|nr:MAG: pyridoxal phosphate-dependent transferase [Monoraphidium minutum]
MMAWCLANGVHFVRSCLAPGGPAFVSAAVLAEREAAAMPGGENAADLDFCASGLRLGCLHSRNPSLNDALVNLAYFTLPSAPIQWLFAELLGDAKFLRHYVAENNRRLLHSYQTLTDALDAAGGDPIPYVPATAAMFLWIDLRAGLRAPTWEEERSLWRYMVDSKRLLLTPGEACHAAEPGFFRVCWAWMPPGALVAAAGRVAAAVREHRALPKGG